MNGVQRDAKSSDPSQRGTALQQLKKLHGNQLMALVHVSV